MLPGAATGLREDGLRHRSAADSRVVDGCERDGCGPGGWQCWRRDGLVLGGLGGLIVAPGARSSPAGKSDVSSPRWLRDREVLGDGVSQGAGGKLHVRNVQGSHSIRAAFRPEIAAVVAEPTSNLSGTVRPQPSSSSSRPASASYLVEAGLRHRADRLSGTLSFVLRTPARGSTPGKASLDGGCAMFSMTTAQAPVAPAAMRR